MTNDSAYSKRERRKGLLMTLPLVVLVLAATVASNGWNILGGFVIMLGIVGIVYCAVEGVIRYLDNR